jgi:hypothetical protein
MKFSIAGRFNYAELRFVVCLTKSNAADEGKKIVNPDQIYFLVEKKK